MDLRGGEIHSLVGENGAGKTTLLGIIYGLVRSDAGSIRIGGESAHIENPRDALALGIGFVQQHFSLIPTLTVSENLVLALRGSKEKAGVRQAAERTRDFSKRFGLDVDQDSVVETLGIGQRQRAELLKAMARETRILLLDEPNALLTPQEWEDLALIFRRLAETGIGVLLVSHKLEEVLRISDRISVLRAGRLVDTLSASQATRAQLAEMMIGELRSTKSSSRPTARVRDERHRLTIDNLWVRSDRGGHAVRGVSFTMLQEEVLGVAGVEGSGQVELTEAIAGVRPIDRGAILLDGQDISGLPVRERHRAGIAHVPADRVESGLVSDLTVLENLLLPVVAEEPNSRFGVLRPNVMAEQARALIERFDIRVPHPGVRASALSGGNQQKLILARELSGRPRVLVCCYPTRGLDFSATEAVRGEILTRRDEGAAVLYASVELDELLEVTDRIIVLHNGELTGEIDTLEASAEQLGLLMGGTAA